MATTMLCTTTPALTNAHHLPSRHTPSLGGQPVFTTMLWTQIICYPRSLALPLPTPPAWHPVYMTMWPNHLQQPQIAY